MVTISELRTLALSFPETTEEPHFEKTSFRVKKKIFATYDSVANNACLKLSATNQYIFTTAGKATIYPVANKWGRQGWTIVEMKGVEKKLFIYALTTAYCSVAPVKLASLVKLVKR